MFRDRCLLAVCTTEGRVKLYRSPFCDFSAEWIEVFATRKLQFEFYGNRRYSTLFYSILRAPRSTDFGDLNHSLSFFLLRKHV